MHRVSQRRVLRLDWPELASGFQAVVASKEIEDLDKLEDVKILLSRSPFGFFCFGKGSESEEIIVTSSLAARLFLVSS